MPLAPFVSPAHHIKAKAGDPLARLTYADIVGDLINQTAHAAATGTVHDPADVARCMRVALEIPPAASLVIAFDGIPAVVTARLDRMFRKSVLIRQFDRSGWIAVERAVRFVANDVINGWLLKTAAQPALRQAS